MISNFNLLTAQKLKYLQENRVSICSSLDGPEHVHNHNRPSAQGNNYRKVTKWVGQEFQKIVGPKKDWHQKNILAIATVSRYSLKYPREIVEEYRKHGLEEIFLHPLYPLGRSKTARVRIGYSMDEYLVFYRTALEHILDLNMKGVNMREKMATVFLKKIMEKHDPNLLELRSPCGGGIGSLVYNYDGEVFSCDLGRALAYTGDNSFRLGTVENKYAELVNSGRTRTLCIASCMDGLPGCNDCAYLPYCGVCPIFNHSEQGSIFGQMPTNDLCKLHKTTLDYLFERMQDKKVRKIFQQWASS